MSTSINIRLPDVDHSYVKLLVKDGYFQTENEVMRAAVRRMRELDAQRTRLDKALEIGLRQIEAGETIEFTTTLLKELGEKAINRAKRGEPITNLDVQP